MKDSDEMKINQGKAAASADYIKDKASAARARVVGKAAAAWGEKQKSSGVLTATCQVSQVWMSCIELLYSDAFWPGNCSLLNAKRC